MFDIMVTVEQVGSDSWWFRQGWHDGQELGERSSREAMADYPEIPTVQAVDSYCQGSVDGRLNDGFRLCLEGA